MDEALCGFQIGTPCPHPKTPRATCWQPPLATYNGTWYHRRYSELTPLTAFRAELFRFDVSWYCSRTVHPLHPMHLQRRSSQSSLTSTTSFSKCSDANRVSRPAASAGADDAAGAASHLTASRCNPSAIITFSSGERATIRSHEPAFSSNSARGTAIPSKTAKYIRVAKPRA